MLSKFISLITIIFILSPINISFSQTPENFIKDVTTKASEILKKKIVELGGNAEEPGT